MTDLAQQFEAAVNTVQTAEGDFKPSNNLKLALYALYKQATEGDVSGKKPGAFDLVGKAKYKAWGELKGTTQNDAKQQYIDKIAELMKQFG